MAGGNPTMMAALMGAMPDSYAVPRASSVSGVSSLASLVNQLDDPYAKELYKARLDVWKQDKKNEYDADQASKLGQVSDRLASILNSRPNLSTDEQAQNVIMHELGMAAQGGLGGALSTIQKLIENSSGAYTDNMKKPDDVLTYEATQRDPNLANFLREKNAGDVPAAIQIAQMLNDPTVSDTVKQDLRYASKMEKNPENAGAVQTAVTGAKENTEAVIKQFDSMPKAFQQYEKFKTGFENTSQIIKEARDLLQQNPGAAGWGSLLSGLPESDANRLSTLIAGIRSNISLQTLQDLKSSSPTGASGFGALSEGELKIITDLLGSLNNTNSPGQLLDTLNEIEARLGNTAQGAYQSLAKDREWFEQNKYQAPALYDRLRGGFDMLQPPQSAQAPVAPAAPPSTTERVTNTRNQLQGQKTPEELAAEELARRQGARR